MEEIAKISHWRESPILSIQGIDHIVSAIDIRKTQSLKQFLFHKEGALVFVVVERPPEQ